MDITARKRAEKVLNRQSAALKAAADGIVITNLDGAVLWVNPAFSDLTGYSRDEVLGQNPRVLKSDKHDAAFYKNMWQTISAGKVWAGEVINRRKDGSLYSEEMSITPVRDRKGAVVNYVAIKRDITRRKRMEEELERARLRMKGELDVGREIQMSMLPLTFPAFPEHTEFSIHATLQPAREVGGDFYDFFFIDDERLCFCVGDVSDKGVPSALFMAVTRTLIKSRATDDHSPASILTHLNDELSTNNKNCMFVTLFLGILNIRTGEVIYTNAGHNPPLVRRSDGNLERLSQRHGPVVGGMEGLTYDESQLRMRPGETFVLYTDGITEAMDAAGSLFSEQRLVEALEAASFDSPESVVRATLERTRQFCGEADQSDDITVLVLQYLGAPDTGPPVTGAVRIPSRLEDIATVQERFEKFARQHDLPGPVVRRFHIAFDEILNNVVSYAFPEGKAHEIEIRWELSGRRLTVIITDDGIPFNPLSVKKPDTTLPLEQRKIGGLGVHLVRGLVDSMSYQRRINRNVLTLVKRVEREEPPPGERA